MVWDASTQFIWCMNGGRVEHGKVAFATTGLSVEVTTRLTKIFSAQVTTITDVGTLVETYFCDKVVTGGAVTLERKLEAFTLEGYADDAVHLSTYAWASVPIGYSPVAGAINGLRFYQLGQSGDGAGVMLLGKVNNNVVLVDTTGAAGTFVAGEVVSQATSLARGVVLSVSGTAPLTLTVRTLEGTWSTGEVTGATSAATMTPNTHVPNAEDPNYFITAANAWLEPEAAHFLDIQASDIAALTLGAGANTWAATDVAAGDLITFGTEGAGTSAPSGARVEVDILPTPYSGTEVSYALFGM